MQIKTLDSLYAAGKIVLVRADMNVPMENGVVTDNSRLRAMRPTLEFLREQGAKIVIFSHFGRPKGEKNMDFTLRPVAEELSKTIGQPVKFFDDCIGDNIKEQARALSAGEIAVCENVRFYAGETKNCSEFAEKLSQIGEAFVNDSFSVSHRAHASVVGITEFLPSYAGRLLEMEIAALTSGIASGEAPRMAIVGGAKVSSKLGVLEHIVDKVDYLVLGGGMANTFLKARGVDVKASLCEDDMLDKAQDIEDKAKANSCTIILPTDAACGTEFKYDAEATIKSVNELADNDMILDIGPDSIDAIKHAINLSKTILWNGPVGVSEFKNFATGMMEIAKEVAKLTENMTLRSIAGGGDTVAALEKADVTDQISYVSMAGGAFLEFLEGKQLPGVIAVASKDGCCGGSSNGGCGCGSQEPKETTGCCGGC